MVISVQNLQVEASLFYPYFNKLIHCYCTNTATWLFKHYYYLLALGGGVHCVWAAAAAACDGWEGGWWYDCEGEGWLCVLGGEWCVGTCGKSCGVVGGANAPTCGCWLLGLGMLGEYEAGCRLSAGAIASEI